MTGKIVAAALTLCLLAGGCASAPRTTFTEADEDAAAPGGLSPVRYWADAPASAFQGTKRRAVPQKGRPFTYLALSGGGGGGAYGAGVLNGWSEAGERPEFTIVSGVSTGALIAPFAFLGSAYDENVYQRPS
jgi:predicted acylesterase/phospholipase RssA